MTNNVITTRADLDALDLAKGGGVVTLVAQDDTTGTVLMIAQADREALERTLDTREMHYRSRTRGLWHKGATSGNTQRVVSLSYDCDRDAVLARVRPAGPACHSGTISCFGDVALRPADALVALDATISSRAVGSANDTSSYTRRLLNDRNLRLKKLGEEAAELAVACADGDRARAVSEAADLLYHMMVALRSVGAGIRDVAGELEARAAPSS
jgi:phosphoribosyl-ATP pyrophosphohydrolase/phosphoribosyl-AMP cyclohydrolase